MEEILNYIDGRLIPAEGGGTLDVYDPAVGAIYATVSDSDERDVEAAVAAAKGAFPAWSQTPVAARAALLSRLADAIAAEGASLAHAESVDTGKPITTAQEVDIPRAERNFRFFAAAVQGMASTCYPDDPAALHYTLRRPVGVAGCISPWNLPLYLLSWKIAPALAAGNCVVAKPSEVTPMTAFLLSKLAIEAGFPPGVLNIVHGRGERAGAAIVAHPEVGAISFTGGTATGAAIARSAAPMFKKLSLELGGKNPTIVFADCNYEEMLPEVVRAAFANQGEICLCGSRVFVERPLFERFRRDFVAETAAWRVGDPLLPGTRVGAVVSEAHYEKVLGYIELARKEGGKIVAGGGAVILSGRCRNGWFIAPTVITGLPYDCRTNQEEIFGPVVTLIPFDTEAEVTAWANATKYGLAASIWTENLSRAHRLARTITAGVVWINCWMMRDLRTPFGGMKASGVGREGGEEALRFFTEPTSVTIRRRPLEER
ncbi:MAG: aldehyde dehydrogenase [Deltaproteobacteria bacterium]|nr:MAG: aldehyde dehydrogenase [Deltaproteobacteria bacterium]